jgi:hypothetical protein
MPAPTTPQPASPHDFGLSLEMAIASCEKSRDVNQKAADFFSLTKQVFLDIQANFNRR